MSETNPGDKPKIFLGINHETGELAEYVSGVPNAVISEDELLNARNDPEVKDILAQAEELSRQYPQ